MAALLTRDDAKPARRFRNSIPFAAPSRIDKRVSDTRLLLRVRGSPRETFPCRTAAPIFLKINDPTSEPVETLGFSMAGDRKPMEFVEMKTKVKIFLTYLCSVIDASREKSYTRNGNNLVFREVRSKLASFLLPFSSRGESS